MLTAMPGQQYSKRELSAMLKGAGFRNIEIKPTFGYLERSHRRETVSRGGGGRTEGGPCVMLKQISFQFPLRKGKTLRIRSRSTVYGKPQTGAG